MPNRSGSAMGQGYAPSVCSRLEAAAGVLFSALLF